MPVAAPDGIVRVYAAVWRMPGPMGEGSTAGRIGLAEAVAIQVGVVIGAGLFSVTGVAIGEAGPGVALAFVIAIAAVSLSLVPTAVLGATFPTTAGNYRYPSRLWSPRVAYVAVWGMAVSILAGGLPLYGLSFGQYLDGVIAVDPRLAGVVVLTALFLVNLIGLEPAAVVQQLLLVTLLVSLGVFIVGGIPSVEAAHLDPPFPTGLSGVLVGAALLYFVCMGANFIVDIGGELREATLTIPRSFLISVPLILVVYVATSLVAVGVVEWDALAGEPLSVAADAALSPALADVFAVGGGLFAIATTINAVYIIAPKYLLALANDGIFPAALAEVNDRFDTPHWGLSLIYVVSIAFLISPLTLEGFSTMMAFGSIALIVPVMVAAIALVRRRPAAYANAPIDIAPRWLTAIAVAALLANVVLFAVLALEETATFLVWLPLTGAGIGYYLVRSWYLSRRGVDLRERIGGDLAGEERTN